MAIGISETKVTGRLIFDMVRGEEKTSRSIDVPFPKVDTVDPAAAASLQAAVNDFNNSFTTNPYNLFVQPANWRDSNASEEQWSTTQVHYEISSVTTTPIEPDSE